MIGGTNPQSHAEFPRVPAIIRMNRTQVRRGAAVASFTLQHFRHSLFVSVGFNVQEKG